MPSTVAVCIPAFRAAFLARTLESVLAQTRPVDEILVVDDNSPEGLEQIVAPYVGGPVRYLRNQANVGIPENYNLALRAAQSDFVMLLGDHDVLKPAYVERCLELFESDPAVDLVFSAVEGIDEAGRVMDTYLHPFPAVAPGGWLARRIATQVASPVNLDTMMRRSALAGLEPWFDPKYWWYGDLYLWIRLACRGKVGYVAEPVLQRRNREHGHYLNDKLWQSEMICDRLRRDAWPLVFPGGGLASVWAGLVYAVRRDWAWAMLVLSLLAQRRAGGDEPGVLPDWILPQFTPWGGALARLLAGLPPGFARGLRRARHALPT